MHVRPVLSDLSAWQREIAFCLLKSGVVSVKGLKGGGFGLYPGEFGFGQT